LLLTATLLIASRASAQEKSKPGRYRLGPFYLTPRVLLTSGVDTNVYNSEVGAVQDNTLVLSPNLDLVIPLGRRFRFKGTGSLDLNYFEKEESERSTDLHGTGQLELRLGRAMIFGGTGGGRQKQRFSSDIDQRLERRFDEIHGGIDYGATRNIHAILQGRQETTTYQDGVVVDGQEVSNALDRDTRSGSAQFRVGVSTRTTLIGLAEIQNDVFLHAPTAFREARSYRYAGGFDFSPKAAVRGTLLIGARVFPDAESQAVPPFSGLMLNVNLQASPASFAQVTATAVRDVQYSVGSVSSLDAFRNSYVSSVYGGGLTVQLPLGLLARGTISFGRADYLLPYEFQGTAYDRLDRLRTTAIAILRGFGRALHVGGTVQWVRRDTNVPGLTYHGTSYGVLAELVP